MRSGVKRRVRLEGCSVDSTGERVRVREGRPPGVGQSPGRASRASDAGRPALSVGEAARSHAGPSCVWAGSAPPSGAAPDAAPDAHTAQRAHVPAGRGTAVEAAMVLAGPGQSALQPAAARSAQGNLGPRASRESTGQPRQPRTSGAATGNVSGPEAGPPPGQGQPCPTRPGKAPHGPSCCPKGRGREFYTSFY